MWTPNQYGKNTIFYIKTLFFKKKVKYLKIISDYYRKLKKKRKTPAKNSQGLNLFKKS